MSSLEVISGSWTTITTITGTSSDTTTLPETTVVGAVLSAVDNQYVEPGSTSVDTVDDGGNLYADGGVAQDATINSGGYLQVSGQYPGTTYGTVINSGGEEYVADYGNQGTNAAYGTIVNSGGLLELWIPDGYANDTDYPYDGELDGSIVSDDTLITQAERKLFMMDL